MKERLFGFTAASDGAMVECKNCGWKPNRREIKGLDPQQVFDLSNGHECEGVESYADYTARDAVELEMWRAKHRRPVETVELPPDPT